MARLSETLAVRLDVPTAEESWARWELLLFLLTAVLAATITLKYAAIQYLEYVYALQIALLCIRFPLSRFQMTWHRPMLRLLGFWVIFLVATMSLAVASLRFEFYFPTNLEPLRFPVLITLSRLIEIALNLTAMFYFVHVFRKSPEKARFAARLYFWVGVASAVYSIISYPLDVLGIASWGAYANLHRFRGFYNEGGPYGLYALSALLVGYALYKLEWESARWAKVGMALMFVAFLGAQSKAAIFALMLLILITALTGGTVVQRVGLVSAAGVFLFGLAALTPLRYEVSIYLAGSQVFERVSHQRATDPNFVYGRVAGAFIVPRMIAAHPWSGIGLGNYGTLRNAPEYRGAAVWAQTADDPGLGIVSYAADLGLPLLTYTFFCLLMPFFLLRRLKAPAYLINLALLQPLVHLFGGQFNLTYPWVVSALALGIAFRIRPFVKAEDIQTTYLIAPATSDWEGLNV